MNNLISFSHLAKKKKILYVAVRIQSSDSAQQFRGFAIQARESTDSFSNDAAYLGQFDSASASGDWKIWACTTVSCFNFSGPAGFRVHMQPSWCVRALSLSIDLLFKQCIKMINT